MWFILLERLSELYNLNVSISYKVMYYFWQWWEQSLWMIILKQESLSFSLISRNGSSQGQATRYASSIYKMCQRHIIHACSSQLMFVLDNHESEQVDINSHSTSRIMDECMPKNVGYRFYNRLHLYFLERKRGKYYWL